MSARRVKAAFFNDGSILDRVYAAGRREAVMAATDLYPHVISEQNFDRYAGEIGDVEVIFTTWGMPYLTEKHLDRLPALRAVFYAAGSVQGFARPILKRGVTVVSAWAANAVPVAEFTAAQILLSNKGYFRNGHDYHSGMRSVQPFHGPGNFGETVALLGAGQIGRKVIELLKPFHLRVVVFDPYLSSEEAAVLGVESVSLEAAFAQGLVVSNHMANIPATVGMLKRPHFLSMRANATFINTGRGATLVESDLIDVLQTRPDLTALLDVTQPEPPVEGSPFYVLPNVHLSSHIAGSIGDEVVRMADYCIEEFERWQAGEPLRYAVTLDMLDTMA